MQVNWIPFFSQTGSEIAEIISDTCLEPLMIITNRKDCNYHELLKRYNVLHFSDFKQLERIKNVLDNNIITLHGFLRIIPDYLITEHMYNGHPGLITKYPELKGFNPQEKAYNMKLSTSGSVIHKVIPEVDSGDVVKFAEVNIKDLELSEVYRKLHDNSVQLWVSFFDEIFS